MKRALSAFLCVFMLMMGLVSCADDTEEQDASLKDKQMLDYLSAELKSFPVDADIGSLVDRLRSEGYVVNDSKVGITGYARLCEFYENTLNGKRDTLKYAERYPADTSAGAEESLFISALYYNGKAYTRITRDIRSSEPEPRRTLRYFLREKLVLPDGALSKNVEHFFLANSKIKTWQDIVQSMLSSSATLNDRLEWGFVISIYYD